MGAICCSDNAQERKGPPGTEGLLLVQAAMRGDATELKLLLQYGKDVNEAAGNKTAIFHALDAGHNSSECVRILAEAGATLETTNWIGETPLIYSCNLGDVGSAAALIKAGAKVDASDGTGRRAVIAAAESVNADEAVRCLGVLVAARANLEVANNNGDNALLRAAMTGHLLCAKFLVESRADVDATDGLGNTALMIARDREKFDVEHFLSPLILTLQMTEEAGADGLTPVALTDMAGEEVVAVRADFGRPVAELRDAVRKQLVDNRCIQILLPDGRFLATPEDGQLLCDVIGDVTSGAIADEYLL